MSTSAEEISAFLTWWNGKEPTKQVMAGIDDFTMYGLGESCNVNSKIVGGLVKNVNTGLALQYCASCGEELLLLDNPGPFSIKGFCANQECNMLHTDITVSYNGGTDKIADNSVDSDMIKFEGLPSGYADPWKPVTTDVFSNSFHGSNVIISSNNNINAMFHGWSGVLESQDFLDIVRYNFPNPKIQLVEMGELFSPQMPSDKDLKERVAFFGKLSFIGDKSFMMDEIEHLEPLWKYMRIVPKIGQTIFGLYRTRLMVDGYPGNPNDEVSIVTVGGDKYHGLASSYVSAGGSWLDVDSITVHKAG